MCISLFLSKHHGIKPPKCNILYPGVVHPYHEVINWEYVTLQATSAKMGNIKWSLSLEVTSCWFCLGFCCLFVFFVFDFCLFGWLVVVTVGWVGFFVSV